MLLSSSRGGMPQAAGILQACLAAFAFSLLLAGTNAATPLMPLYREVLGFSPATMSMTFVFYVGTLVMVLLCLARPAFLRFSAPLLVGALLMAAIADLFLATATEPGILAGRAFFGVAGGMGTGAAAALVVVAIGTRGRSLSATGNLVGAVLGTTGAQIGVSLLGQLAMHWVYWAHGIACLITLALLAPLLIWRHGINKDALSPAGGAARAPLKFTPRVWLALGVGCVTWLMLSAAVVFFPTYFKGIGQPAVAAMGMILMQVASVAAQLGSPALARAFPGLSGLLIFAAGACLALLGGALHWQWVSLAGFIALGAGIGLAYRLCLVVLTKGASPAVQGAMSSLYAAVTYALAATSVLLLGLVANRIGLNTTIEGLLAGLAVLAVLLSFHAPRLREAAEQG